MGICGHCSEPYIKSAENQDFCSHYCCVIWHRRNPE